MYITTCLEIGVFNSQNDLASLHHIRGTLASLLTNRRNQEWEDNMQASEVVQAIITLFTEAYAGPPDPKSTWFIDNEPDSGILGLTATVTPEEASWSSHQNDPGTTIAGHVEHLRWSLANANSAMLGKPYQSNWSESWNTLEADQTKWDWLRLSLRTEYEMLVENLQKQPELSGDYLLGVMALLPHAAYHLGTIRQLIERTRQGSAAR